MIGCAAVLAIVPLLIGTTVACFMTGDIPWYGRVVAALTPAAITFVAALLLIASDNARHKRNIAAVRRVLLEREPVNDELFCAQFPDVDSDTLRLTREGIAKFFDVPAGAIHASDQLEADLRFSSLEPAFHTCVTCFVLERRGAIEAPFTFRNSRVSDVGTLAAEIDRILKRLQRPA